MNKSMIVAITDFKNALNLRFIKMGLIMAVALGPAMAILIIGMLVVLLPPAELGILLAIMIPMVSGLLALFAIIPTTMIAANALVGEREMNTLEPLLCTPLTDRELLWGKTLASAIPSLLILGGSVAITAIGVNIIMLVMGLPLIMIPDLPGLFLLGTATPVMIFAIVAVMIIVSGRVTRVYEAYQMTSMVVIVFIIPIFIPLVGLETGIPDPSLAWLGGLITLLISAVLFAIAWALALKMFNRDKLVSMV